MPYQWTTQHTRNNFSARRNNYRFETTYGVRPSEYPNIPPRSSSRKKIREEQRTEDFEIRNVHKIPIQTRGFEEPKERKEKNSFFQFFVFGAMTLLLFAVLLSAALSFCELKYNDVLYGTPRSFHTLQEINGISTYITAINLHKKIVIIECPALDCTKAKVFAGHDLHSENSIVFLSFRDLGNGHTDMIIHAESQQWLLLNNGKDFDASLQPTQNEIEKMEK
jgi:hypothetical protein